MIKTFKVKKVQSLILKETHTTQALKAYIKLKGIPLPVLLNTGASVSVISNPIKNKYMEIIHYVYVLYIFLLILYYNSVYFIRIHFCKFF